MAEPQGSNYQPVAYQSAIQVDYRTADLGLGGWTLVSSFESIGEYYRARSKLSGFQIESLMDTTSHPGMFGLLVATPCLPRARQLLNLADPSTPVAAIPMQQQAAPASPVVRVDVETFAKLCRHPDVKLIAVAREGDAFKYLMHLEGLLFSTESLEALSFADYQQLVQASAIELSGEAVPVATIAVTATMEPPIFVQDRPPYGSRTFWMAFFWIALVIVVALMVWCLTWSS